MVKFVVATVAFATLLTAQTDPRGLISGQITGSSGAVVSQAGVKVTNVETGVVTTTASNDHGDRRVFVGVKVLF
jgi:hypothetical protein